MYIYGKNVALEALKKKERVKKVYLNQNFHDEELLFLIEQNHLSTKIVDKNMLDRMVGGNHQGIILEVPDYEYAELEDLFTTENPLLVILDHLEDPHNFGAIIRTCEAAGVDGIIIPKDRSVEVNGTVSRVSVGAISSMKIARVTNLVRTLDELKKNGFWIVGTDMNGTDYDKIDYRGKIAIIIGNEGSGMSRLVEENCDFIASIPMKGKINSLNASVAAGIVIFEAVKNRR